MMFCKFYRFPGKKSGVTLFSHPLFFVCLAKKRPDLQIRPVLQLSSCSCRKEEEGSGFEAAGEAAHCPVGTYCARCYSHSILIKVFLICLVDIKCFYFYRFSKLTIFFKVFRFFVVKSESPLYFWLREYLSSLSPDLPCHFCKTAST